MTNGRAKILKVLLIEDDLAMRTGIEGNLELDGHSVEAHASVEALGPITRLTDIDLLITDHQLPGENGLEFADRFHALRPEVPIVLITAYFSRDLEARVGGRGFVRLLRKPFVYEEFHELIQRMANHAWHG